MIKLGVIGSTNGTDLQAVLDAITYGELVAKVSVVISNNEKAHILDRAKNNDIPAVFIPHSGKTREEFDNEITAVLKKNPDRFDSAHRIHANLIIRILPGMARSTFECPSVSPTKIRRRDGHQCP